MSASFVIPHFKSTETLPRMVEELTDVETLGFPGEVILICDDDSDETWKMIQDIPSNGQTRGYRLGKDQGQHRATLYGVTQAKYDLIVTLDDDNEYPINAVPAMVKKLHDGFDLVYGKPAKHGHGWLKKILSMLFKMIISRFGIINGAERISGMCAFKRQLVDEIDPASPLQANLDSILDAKTQRVSSVDMEVIPRKSRNSNYTVRKLLRHAMTVVFARTDVIASFLLRLGTIGIFISLSFGVLTLMSFLLGIIRVPGLTTAMLFNAFCFSILFGIQGIIGRLIHLSLYQANGQSDFCIRDHT